MKTSPVNSNRATRSATRCAAAAQIRTLALTAGFHPTILRRRPISLGIVSSRARHARLSAWIEVRRVEIYWEGMIWRNIMKTANPQWEDVGRELRKAIRRHWVPFLIREVITGTLYRPAILYRSRTERSCRTSPPSIFTFGALIVLVLLSLGAHSAKAEEGYIGTWGTGPAQCALGQEREDAPLIMTATGYDQYKRHCSFRSGALAQSARLERSACP
jgi:hypothetical protein